jgi:hypothetical protein
VELLEQLQFIVQEQDLLLLLEVMEEEILPMEVKVEHVQQILDYHLQGDILHKMLDVLDKPLLLDLVEVELGVDLVHVFIVMEDVADLVDLEEPFVV